MKSCIGMLNGKEIDFESVVKMFGDSDSYVSLDDPLGTPFLAFLCDPLDRDFAERASSMVLTSCEIGTPALPPLRLEGSEIYFEDYRDSLAWCRASTDDERIALLQKPMANDPENLVHLHNLFRAYIISGRSEEAIAIGEKYCCTLAKMGGNIEDLGYGPHSPMEGELRALHISQGKYDMVLKLFLFWRSVPGEFPAWREWVELENLEVSVEMVDAIASKVSQSNDGSLVESLFRAVSEVLMDKSKLIQIFKNATIRYPTSAACWMLLFFGYVEKEFEEGAMDCLMMLDHLCVQYRVGMKTDCWMKMAMYYHRRNERDQARTMLLEAFVTINARRWSWSYILLRAAKWAKVEKKEIYDVVIELCGRSEVYVYYWDWDLYWEALNETYGRETALVKYKEVTEKALKDGRCDYWRVRKDRIRRMSIKNLCN
jgi:tetratricopeptide (TPR) repeat protein